MDDLGQRQDQQPPQDDVHGPAQRRQPLDRQQLDGDPHDGAGPGQTEDRHGPRAVQHEQRDRRVGPGDQHEDHRVVEALHPHHRAGRPLQPVVQRARAVHPRQGQCVDRRADPGDGAGGGHDHGHALGDRGEERHLVQAPAEPRLLFGDRGGELAHGALLSSFTA